METKQRDSVFKLVFSHRGRGCCRIQQRLSEKITHKIFKCGNTEPFLWSSQGGSVFLPVYVCRGVCVCVYLEEGRIWQCLESRVYLKQAVQVLRKLFFLSTHKHTQTHFSGIPSSLGRISNINFKPPKLFGAPFDKKTKNNFLSAVRHQLSWMTDDKQICFFFSPSQLLF